jgi:uncharacterized repeat protein (TIGR04052 family)
MRNVYLIVLSLLSHSSLACSSDDTEAEPKEMSEFSLSFRAVADGNEVGCSDTLTGLGPDAEYTAGPSDLRFYVSNLVFENAAGEELEITLHENEFQYSSDAGSVVLIDLTSNDEGSCEGTAVRTNEEVAGETFVEDVVTVSFDVGVPQALMQETIATNTAEGAPSPLNEMYWNWATGYRHFVFNFTVEGPEDGGDGYLHVGSRDCGPEDGLALEDRDECGFLNTPQVRLEDFDLENDVVEVDLVALLAELDFIAPIYDPETFEVIGEGPGAECHSAPTQPDCELIFTAMGLDSETGDADASENSVFKQ